VRRTRERVGPDFIMIFRLSMLDLVEGGSTLGRGGAAGARRIEQAGATIINTGIGWHEARVPTIATKVPRAAFAWVTQKLKGKVAIPLVTTNRINTPEVAEAVLAEGRRRHGVDGAAASWPTRLRAQGGRGPRRRDQHLHRLQPGLPGPHLQNKITSCLVNPRACHETELNYRPRPSAQAHRRGRRRSGRPACATTAAERGHDVTLFEAAEIGGQFNIAKQVPGKEEFHETLRYFGRQLELTGVAEAEHAASPPPIWKGGFDEVVLATGIAPRRPDPRHRSPKVLGYLDVLRDKQAGGQARGDDRRGRHRLRRRGVPDPRGPSPSLDAGEVLRGMGHRPATPSRRPAAGRTCETAPREVYLLQRKASKVGDGLGKTTGWIHRTALKNRGVEMLSA
jgi:2,4-dienoyl-CoA reductase (NADPH2)